MSICPDCNGCAYFGEGMFGEAAPFFQDLAAKFIITHAMTDTAEVDLTKLKQTSLRRFVEQNQPDPVSGHHSFNNLQKQSVRVFIPIHSPDEDIK
jgi:hypothetical protein